MVKSIETLEAEKLRAEATLLQLQADVVEGLANVSILNAAQSAVYICKAATYTKQAEILLAEPLVA